MVRGILHADKVSNAYKKHFEPNHQAHILDDVVSESQCGFRKCRGTVDMVFAIRQLQEKCV